MVSGSCLDFGALLRSASRGNFSDKFDHGLMVHAFVFCLTRQFKEVLNRYDGSLLTTEMCSSLWNSGSDDLPKQP